MKDIHTHILYDVDDGSATIEESIEMLRIASNNNVTDVVLTPHYINHTKFNINNKTKEKLLKELKKELSKRNIEINLYLGNEVYIDKNIISLYKEISTINNSRYILIELPLNNKYPFLDEVLIELKNNNLIPIIAHPERYTVYYKNYDFFEYLVQKGCLLQGNIGSLYGMHGRKAKKMLKELLKRNLIHVIASDTHHNAKIYKKNINKKLLRIIKDIHMVEKLLETNPDKIIKNKEITKEE